MSRWEPNSRERLYLAALELYLERGFDQTTVAEIAGRAGLTERTFFRYFADKREVLFTGTGDLTARITAVIEQASESTSPIDAAIAALATVCEFMQGQREVVLQRRAVIAATPELRERELIKLASWSELIAEALRGRGASAREGQLAAQIALALFHVAFERWVEDDAAGRDMTEVLYECLAELRTMSAGSESVAA